MSLYDELRQALDVKAVAQHLGLKRRGVYVKCPHDDCPSHKKGRLTARSLEGERMGCLACKEPIGDAVDLIQIVRGCSRTDATAEARDLAGLESFKPAPYTPPEEAPLPPDMEQRIAALTVATEHYHRILTEGVEYLHGIGVTNIDDATRAAQTYVAMRGFSTPYPLPVGVVPTKLTGLRDVMPAELRDAAVRAGVLQARGVERLAGRVWLPWTDEWRTVSYKARAIDGLCRGQKWASPRTADTGRGLMQMPRPSLPFGADAAALLDGTWAVAEAELDALALLSAGVPAVAVGGTSGVGSATLHRVLPEGRAALLYDSDDAGKAGAEKEGRRLGIPWATMPGQDPADVLRTLGVDRLRATALEAIANAHTAEEKRTEIERSDESLADLCTEQGTARAFIEWADGRILFLNDRDRWAVYTGKRWEVQPKRAPDVVALFEEFFATFGERVEALSAAGLHSDAEFVEEWRLKLRSLRTAKAVDDYAKADRRAQASMDDFDTHDMLLNAQNGVINLTTGELKRHDPAHRMMQIVSCDYDPDARSEVWESMLDRVMCDDFEMVNYLRRIIGYTITGRANEECLWLHYGPKGRNGKGTFVSALQDLLGEYQQSADFSTFIRKRFVSSGPNEDIAELAGKRAVFASESNRGHHLDEALVKNLTGQDIVRARFLNEGGFQFRPKFKLHFSTNYLPQIGGQDGGIWGRVLVVQWNAYFGGDDRTDPDIKAKLRTPEAQRAILAWAVYGCLAYQRDGLQHPEKVQRWTQEYKEESDTLGEWLEERTQAVDTAWSEGKALYNSYVNWCESVHERPIGRKSFAQAMVERGFPRERNSTRTKRGHAGLQIVPVTVGALRAV